MECKEFLIWDSELLNDVFFFEKASLKSHTARHFGGPKKCETTGPKPLRKPRSDKGKSKKSMAAILSGLTVSKEENDRLLKTID